MRYLVASLLVGLPFSPVFAQEKLPARFAPLTKNDRFRLVRVMGMPELPAVYMPTSAISANGRWAVFAEDLSSGSDATPSFRTRLLVWDLQALAWPREIMIDGKNVIALILSQDGSKVLLSGLGSVENAKKKEPTLAAYLMLLDLATGKAERTIAGNDKPFHCIALSPDQQTALTGVHAKVAQWDLKTGKQTATYEFKNLEQTSALAYLPGGKQFLVGYLGGQVCLFNIGAEKPAQVYKGIGQDDFIAHLAVSSDGKRFATGEPQMGIVIWDITGKKVATMPNGKNSEVLTAMGLSSDGKTVFGSWIKPMPEVDDFACSRLTAFSDAGKPLWSKTVSYRGQPPMLVQGDKLLIGGGPNVFDIWSIKDGKNLQHIGGPKSPISAIATLANGDFASAGLEGTLFIWNNGKLVRREPGHTAAVAAIAVSNDRKHWLTGGNDHVVRYWSTGNSIELPKKHAAAVTSLAFSSDGAWAVSGSADRTARTWDLKSPKEIASFAGHSEAVNAVALSPDDRWLATGSADTTIKVWPIKNGKPDPDREAVVLEGHEKGVTCLTFSADGKTLISGSQDQTLKVWDWAKEKCVRTIPGHKNWITSVLLVDPRTLVTTSDDLTLCWWELETGKEIGRFDFGAVGDCPRCVTRIGTERLLVGTSSWLIYELQMTPPAQSGKGAASSK
ncbi:MAG TPA: WD40 repeat domain-containing protein [Gemmataceae bacterium]|nr:WD40 repeat domain-containing protein [Gemmataceae bacterium]